MKSRTSSGVAFTAGGTSLGVSVFWELLFKGKSFSDEGLCLVDAAGLTVRSLWPMMELLARHWSLDLYGEKTKEPRGEE
jgi:hypothetical protein